jgi:hypothetical protein
MTADTVTIPLRVENLGVAFHPGTHVRCCYQVPDSGNWVFVSGELNDLTRGAPGQPTNLQVDGLYYAVPAGTLIQVDARELR